jgi:HlyD family secretion protein
MINKIKNFLKIIWGYIKTHKIKSSVVLIVLIIATYFGANFIFGQKDEETRYIMTAVTKGTVEFSISGTGQVEAASVKEVSSEASGKITYLNPNVKIGSSIKSGTLIAIVDNADAQRSVNSAELAVENAEDALETAQIDLDDLIGLDESNPKVVQDAEDDLEKSYEDGYNDVSSAFLDFPSIMKDLDSILFDRSYNNYQKNIDYYFSAALVYDSSAENYKTSAQNSYDKAKASYDVSFANYKTCSIYSNSQEISSLISDTYETSKLIAQSLKDALNLIQFYQEKLSDSGIDIPSTSNTHISTLSSQLGTTNINTSSLFNATSDIENNLDTLDSSDDQIRSAQLALKSKQQALQTAKDNLADSKDSLYEHSIYANLSGTISAVNIESGDKVSSGSSLITIVTTSKIASITMSETDIANVKVGNKARLTFDAIEDLEIEGVVSQVDVAGSASSGVVSYGLEISFDTDNETIKPGMSVSATIVTDSKENVLMLPSAAVKELGMGYYVQVLGKEYDLTDRQTSIRGVTSDTAPENKEVQIGLVGDEYTEITSGLEEDDQVVLRQSTSQTTTTSTSSGSTRSTGTFNIQGGGGGPSGSFTAPGM